MAAKSRYQNPIIGDTVALNMFVYNSNNTAALDSITEVNIYYLDPNAVSESNPDGRTLIETVPGGSVTNPAQGEYLVDLFLDPSLYTNTGRYVDEWIVVFQSGDTASPVEHLFQIYPDLWYTTPIPVVYDFAFHFQPNKFRMGTKKFIEIEIVPNVPRATDLEAYYENLAIAANVYVSIARRCGDCVPVEEDLKLVVDRASTQYKEKCRAYYYLDTTLFECGIYDLWVELEFGGNIYVGDVNQIQIYS